MPTILCQECGEQAYRYFKTCVRCQPCASIATAVSMQASSRVHRAVAVGLLPDLRTGNVACADCGKQAFAYDHRDYSKPLVVDPVCRSCNGKRGAAAPLATALIESLRFRCQYLTRAHEALLAARKVA